MRRAVAAGVALVSSVLLLPGAPSVASTTRPPCLEVVASPTFVRDRTAFCSQVVYTDTDRVTLSLFRTTNGGRTWSRRPAAGLSWDVTDGFTAQSQFSSSYSTDHQLLVATNDGLYVTTDGGGHFTLLDPRMSAAGPGNPVVYTGPAGTLAPVLGTGTFALRSGLTPARVDLATGLHQPVIGVVDGFTQRFVPPAAAGGQVLAMSYEDVDPATPDVVPVLWGCNADVVCAERRAELPVSAVPSRFWHVPLANHKDALVAFAQQDGKPRVYVSYDDGRTIHRWARLDALVAAAAEKDVLGPFVGLAVNPARPGLVYARVVVEASIESLPRRREPREQIFRSTDGGTSWRRVGYQYDLAQRGLRGTLPWNGAAYGVTEDRAAIALTADGRVLVPAARRDEGGLVPGTDSVYCSLDGARTWKVLCPR